MNSINTELATMKPATKIMKAVMVGMIPPFGGARQFRPIPIGSLEMMRLKEQALVPIDRQVLHRFEFLFTAWAVVLQCSVERHSEVRQTCALDIVRLLLCESSVEASGKLLHRAG
jgi:hypothetical protein